MGSFKELCEALTERIDKSATRERGPTAEAKQNLLTSTYQLVGQLWKGTQIHEGYEAGINKRSNWYSSSERYRQPGLTYRQTVAAYEGLQELNLIKETKTGFLDRETFEGSITKFVATDELLQMLSEMIDQIGGWCSGKVGEGYGQGHSTVKKAHWMQKLIATDECLAVS